MNRTVKTGYANWRIELLEESKIPFKVENDKIVVTGIFNTGKELLDYIFKLLNERRKSEPNFGK